MCNMLLMASSVSLLLVHAFRSCCRGSTPTERALVDYSELAESWFILSVYYLCNFYVYNLLSVVVAIMVG